MSTQVAQMSTQVAQQVKEDVDAKLASITKKQDDLNSLTTNLNSNNEIYQKNVNTQFNKITEMQRQQNQLTMEIMNMLNSNHSVKPSVTR